MKLKFCFGIGPQFTAFKEKRLIKKDAEPRPAAAPPEGEKKKPALSEADKRNALRSQAKAVEGKLKKYAKDNAATALAQELDAAFIASRDADIRGEAGNQAHATLRAALVEGTMFLKTKDEKSDASSTYWSRELGLEADESKAKKEAAKSKNAEDFDASARSAAVGLPDIGETALDNPRTIAIRAKTDALREWKLSEGKPFEQLVRAAGEKAWQEAEAAVAKMDYATAKAKYEAATIKYKGARKNAEIAKNEDKEKADQLREEIAQLLSKVKDGYPEQIKTAWNAANVDYDKGNFAEANVKYLEVKTKLDDLVNQHPAGPEPIVPGV